MEEEGRVAVWDSRKGSFWNEYGRRGLSKHRLCKREARKPFYERRKGTCKPFYEKEKAHVSLSKEGKGLV